MERFLLFVVVGVIAQTIDGVLGMAYGVSCTTFLMSLGMAPLVASASVKTAEVFTTAASGLSHLRQKNIDQKLFVSLLVPGILGGALGAYFFSQASGQNVKPFVACYLLVMGSTILCKATFKKMPVAGKRHPALIGFFGGLFDAMGGGWGPIVTSSLLAEGNEPNPTFSTHGEKSIFF